MRNRPRRDGRLNDCGARQGEPRQNVIRLDPPIGGRAKCASFQTLENAFTFSHSAIIGLGDLPAAAVARPGWNVMERRRRRCSFLGPQDELTLFAAGEETFLDHVAD